MSDPYLGEIQAFAFNYYPKYWLPCDGRLIPITQNTALFSLIGTYYGGDGRQNFALPNLVGSVAISQGQGPGLPSYSIGESLGEMAVTLSTGEMPAHTHGLQLGTASGGATPGPSNASNVVINPVNNGFVAPPANTALATNGMTMTGGSQPHPNAQPTLAMIYCICTSGIYPSFN